MTEPAMILDSRCHLRVVREGEHFYRVTCACARIAQVYSTRGAATRAAVRHGNESQRGYSVTQR